MKKIKKIQYVNIKLKTTLLGSLDILIALSRIAKSIDIKEYPVPLEIRKHMAQLNNQILINNKFFKKILNLDYDEWIIKSKEII